MTPRMIRIAHIYAVAFAVLMVAAYYERHDAHGQEVGTR